MEKDRWDERYESGEYRPRGYPSTLLGDAIEWLPEGRAIDVATGTGRNALFLAEHGYEVDALDVSEAALSIARDAADDRSLDVNWVQTDVEDYDFPDEEYDVAVVCFYHSPALIPKLVTALSPGGVLVHEHHVRTTDPVDRGPSEEHRYRTNDLLRYCLGLTVLQYSEGIRTFESGDRGGSTAAVASIVARKSHGGRQSHPPERSRE